jgi:tRNA threonylcarbamoyladenosine biosynthesis protein TsaB
MILLIKSQDIKEVEFALIKEGEIVSKTKKAVSPEKQLFELDSFLKEEKVELKDLEKVFVVSGPGSFTASRLSVTIANTISFVQDVPVVSIENEGDLSMEGLVEEFLKEGESESRFASPTYNKPPRIT